VGAKYKKARIGAATIDRLQDGEMVMDIEEPGFGVPGREPRASSSCASMHAAEGISSPSENMERAT
jgi:hypothetical protein